MVAVEQLYNSPKKRVLAKAPDPEMRTEACKTARRTFLEVIVWQLVARD